MTIISVKGRIESFAEASVKESMFASLKMLISSLFQSNVAPFLINQKLTLHISRPPRRPGSSDRGPIRSASSPRGGDLPMFSFRRCCGVSW